MRLLFKSPAIAAVVLAGTSDGRPNADGERGSGDTPAQLRQAIMQGVRPQKEKNGILGRDADAFPLKADRDPRALAAAAKPTCVVNGVETEFVDCTGDGADCKQKCLDACAGVDDCSCCVGGVFDFLYFEACNGFQGKVCPDGSCSGVATCEGATIGYVVDGCQGNSACFRAGQNGHLGRVVSSCNDREACRTAAAYGGDIQEISSSCNAEDACRFAAGDGGGVQEISSSCNAIEACRNAARAGTIPNNMFHCCNSESMCEGLARDGQQQDPDPDQCDAPPSRSPTKAPINAAPWDIKFISVEPDFSTSGTDELVLTFEVGRGRKVEHGVYRKDCSTAIAGTAVTVAETREDKDLEYDTLVLAVDVDKTAIALSNIWNEEASMVEVCTVVHLISEDDELGEMIVAEMKRVTEIDYDLDALYNATLALSEGVVEKDTESFDATSVLSICKCTSLENFTCSDDPLSPDQNDLFLCYTSVDESIEVQTVLSLTIAQEGRQSFPAISDGAVRVEAISSTRRKEDGSGYAVWTRVPVAFGDDPGRIAFDFAAGSALALSGEVSLRLTGTVYNETGSETRKLQAGGETAAAVAIIEDVASYEIQVELKGSAEQVIEAVSVFSSAASVVIGKVVSIVAVIASLAH